MERIGKLWSFSCEKTLINPQFFKPTHWLQPTPLISNTYYQNENVLYNYTKCVFLEKNIVEIEKDNPEFLWKNITDKITEDKGLQIFKWRVEYNEPQDPQQISILKQKLDQSRKQLTDRQQEVMELKEKLATYERESQEPLEHERALDGFFEKYPILHKIFELHNDGKEIDDIVMSLTGGNEKLASAVLTGWLLQPDLSIKSVDAIKQKINRIKKDKMQK